MLVSIQDLRSIQERCEIGELVQRLDVSIDRLTVIWDTDTGSLRRIFKNLKQAISTRVDSFEIHDNVRDDVFTLAREKLLLIIVVLKQKNLQSQKLNRFCKNFV